MHCKKFKKSEWIQAPHHNSFRIINAFLMCLCYQASALMGQAICVSHLLGWEALFWFGLLFGLWVVPWLHWLSTDLILKKCILFCGLVTVSSVLVGFWMFFRFFCFWPVTCDDVCMLLGAIPISFKPALKLIFLCNLLFQLFQGLLCLRTLLITHEKMCCLVSLPWLIWDCSYYLWFF